MVRLRDVDFFAFFLAHEKRESKGSRLREVHPRVRGGND